MSRRIWTWLLGAACLSWMGGIAAGAATLDLCRKTAANREGYGPIRYQGTLPVRFQKPDSTAHLCIADRPCYEAENEEGYGQPFWSDEKLYRKYDQDWSNTAGTNWCRVQSRPGEAKAGLFEHRGQKLFLTGVNLGNVQFLPFKNNPYIHSEVEIKSMLRKAFQDLSASGTNSYRFWLHIDGARSPSFQTGVDPKQALVTGLPPGLIDDLKWIIRTAYQDYGLLINVTLWSHDVLAVRREHDVASRDRVLHLMNDEKAMQHYIDKALTPMVKAMEEKMPGSDLAYKDAIMSWEVFNEPEGVSWHWRLYWNYQYRMEYGDYSWRRVSLSYLANPARSESAFDTGSDEWAPIRYKGWHFVGDGSYYPGFNLYLYKDVTDDYPSEWDFLKKAIVDDKTLKTVEIPYQNVQRFINRIAGAIHRLDPEAKVSTGTHSMPYNTDREMEGLGYENAPFNYYSDAELIKAGGDPLGTLDFYQVHGYPEWNEAEKDGLINMFKHPNHHWKLDKPLIVGEHWSIIGSGNEFLKPYHYEHLYDTGYAGVWGWAYFYVREKQDASGRPLRYIDKHENQDFYRQLFQSLPSRLKYKAP